MEKQLSQTQPLVGVILEDVQVAIHQQKVTNWMLLPKIYSLGVI
jgi:hypothetical protein